MDDYKMQIYNKYKIEIFIFLLAFGLRFLYAILVLFFFGEHGFIAHSDAFSFYLRGAENLINHHIFSLNTNTTDMPDAYRTPLYTFFVAGFLWLKLPLISVIFLQNIMAGLISVFIYRIGRLLGFPYGVNLFAAVLTALEPASIYWGNLLMSDYLFAFLFVWSVYEFFMARYYLFSLLLGLATLTRPTSLYFFPLFLLVMLLRKISLNKIILAFLVFFIVLFPWLLRNKIVFDTWDLTSASWYNLYGILAQKFAYDQNFILSRPALPANYPNPQTFAYDPANTPFYKQHFWEIVKARPWAYAKFHTTLAVKSRFVNYYQILADYVIKAKFPALAYGVPSIVLNGAVVVAWGGWILLYILMLISFFEKSRRTHLLAFSGMVAVIMFTAGSTGSFGADGSRFILPLQPFMFLFAAGGFNFIYNRLKYVFAQ